MCLQLGPLPNSLPQGLKNSALARKSHWIAIVRQLSHRQNGFADLHFERTLDELPMLNVDLFFSQKSCCASDHVVTKWQC